MLGVKIKRKLGRKYFSFLMWSVLFFPLVVLMVSGMLQEHQRREFSDWRVYLFTGVLLLLLVVYVFALAQAIWRLMTLVRHPDLVDLARYGPPSKVLPAIEAELADEQQVVRVGKLIRSLRVVKEAGDLGHAEVQFTPSWLIYVTAEGSRMQFFRLDSIVLAGRIANSVVLADEYGSRLEIPGTEAGVTRLLAEVLTRVPWALNHFDSETENTWADNRQQIIAQVDQRRARYKASQTDNEPPGLSRRLGVQGPPG